MTEQPQEKQTSDPEGGLSASGRTADDFSPDSQLPGDDYGTTGDEVAEDASEKQ